MLQYAADGLFNPSTMAAEAIFWTLPALLLALQRPVPIENVETATGETGARKYLAAGLAVILASCGLLLTASPFLADIKLQQGLNLAARHDLNTVFKLSEAFEANPREAAYPAARGGYIFNTARLAPPGEQKELLLGYAIEAFEEAGRLEPYNIFRLYAVADVYTYWAFQGATEKWDEVFRVYGEILFLSPDNAVMLNRWALALTLKGDLATAQARLEQAVAADPDWTDDYNYGGLIASLGGDYVTAVSSLTAPLSQDVLNIRYFRNLCFNIYEYGKLPPLIEALESRQQPGWQVNALLGVTGFLTDWEESLARFDAAMAEIPDKDAADLFRFTLELAERIPDYGPQLAGMATGWRDKLALSPDAEVVLEELDEFLRAYAG